jgi:hypothetical protein
MGGKVGIGTVSPVAKLHSLATTEQLRLGYDASNYASFTVASDGALTIQTAGTDEDIEIRTGGFDNAIFIDDSTSNVGIGTASPDTELHVNGDIKQKVTTSDVSNQPLDSELDTLWTSPATQGDGWTAYLKDSDSSNFYQIVAVGSEWYVFTGVKATG